MCEVVCCFHPQRMAIEQKSLQVGMLSSGFVVFAKASGSTRLEDVNK